MLEINLSFRANAAIKRVNCLVFVGQMPKTFVCLCLSCYTYNTAANNNNVLNTIEIYDTISVFMDAVSFLTKYEIDALQRRK